MALRNIQFIGESGVSDNLENNILSYFNWQFLNTCAFGNVVLASSGNYGGNASTLRCANNSNYTYGKVWESARKQWIWQSGVECTTQPIRISGVYVNNIFRPATGVGAYSFNIDYPNGRIIFNSAISPSSSVKLEFSYNYIQLYNADSPWWREVQRNSFRFDDVVFPNSSSGVWAKAPEQRIQLPAIVFQSTPNLNKTPYNIGSHAHLHQQEVRCYIITETNRDLKWIIDAIGGQYDQIISAFDSNKLLLSGVYPINMDTGSLNNNTKNYPDLVQNYSWNRPISFKKINGWIPEGMNRSNDVIGLVKNASVPIFSAVLQLTLETYLG